MKVAGLLDGPAAAEAKAVLGAGASEPTVSDPLRESVRTPRTPNPTAVAFAIIAEAPCLAHW